MQDHNFNFTDKSTRWVSDLFNWQGAVNKNVPIYKEAVKSNIVVKIDQERFLPSEM